MKKIILFLMCFVLLFVMIGCGNKDAPTNIPNETINLPTEEVAGETTVSTEPNQSDVELENGRENVLENQNSDEESETPNVKPTESTTNDKTEIIPTETEKIENKEQTEETNIENTVPEETKKAETPQINTDHTPSAIELEVLTLMNEKRANEGLPALTYNNTIYDCGVIRANECLTKWSHTRPNGTQYWTVFEDCNKKITTCCGENLAKIFTSAEQIVEVLMNSEGHKKNILYKDFTSVCITILKDEDGYYYMSQLFMGK